MLKKIFFISIMSVLIISCDKEQIVKTNYNSEVPYSYGSNYHDYSALWNSNNPIDSIGYWHNVFMDSLKRRRDEISTTNVSQFFNSIYNILKTSAVNLNMDTTGYYTGTHNIINCDTIDFQEYHSIFTDTITINLHSQIVEILIDVDSQLEVIPAINTIKSIENQIGSLNITNNEKQALYGATSVAKFSLKYWNDEIVGGIGTSEWIEDEEHSNSLWVELGTVALSDMLGYYSGFTYGLNPQMGIVGAATSSATTAIYFWGDSIWDGIKEVGNWLWKGIKSIFK
mgnify:CR=1 FL=1